MAQEGALDLDRPEPVAGNLDDLVCPAGEPDIPVGVDMRRVTDVVAARDPIPVVSDIALGFAP